MWSTKKNDKHREPAQSELDRSFALGGTLILPSKEIQHTWLELTRARAWKTLALVPVEDTGATLALGHELAKIAALDPRNKVLLINATGVLMSEDINQTPMASHSSNSNLPPGFSAMANGKYWLYDCSRLSLDDSTIGLVEVPKYLDPVAQGQGAYTLAIVATSSPLVKPSAVSAARSAEVAALCISLGFSHFSEAQRVKELVGEERVLGAVTWRLST